jgi:tRNA-specific 2-thiouridylase
MMMEQVQTHEAPGAPKVCAVDAPLPAERLHALVEGRVVVAMSGGVDSSVVAALVAQQGFDAVGVSMRLYSTPPSGYTKSCCSPDDLFDARMIADNLGIPFYVANYQDVFRERVIAYFVEEYRRGRTPNPCVACNNHVKFNILLERSLALGARYLATGHFVRIVHVDGEPRLFKGCDPAKDQSYFLFGIPRKALPRLMFPLGEMTKREVRELARGLGLETADKPESQEICFVAGESYQEFVAARLAEGERIPGVFVHAQTGEVLGRHDGIHQYTVGQRKGLGIAYSEPLYVHAIRPDSGEVVVGPRQGLDATGLIAGRCNWLSWEVPPERFICDIKIRYRSQPVPASVEVLQDGRCLVRFGEPQRAVCPGQAAVFYRGDEVLGGGWIEEARG